MNLNKRTPTGKLYAACYIMANKLFGKEHKWLITNDAVDMPTNTNFCPLMRAIFLWTPVYLLLFLGVSAGVFYTAFLLPGTLGGLMGYINTYIIPGGIIGLIVLIAWGAAHWRDKYVENKESLTDKKARHEAGNYTFVEVFIQWIIALHEKTCPLITIVDEPVTKKVVIEPTPPNPSPVVNGEADLPVVDDEADVTPAKTPEESPEEIKIWLDEVLAKPPFITLFLARWLPSFWPMAGILMATVVAGLINIAMANIMEHEPVVFAKAECEASYDVKTSTGTIVCGDFTHKILNTNRLYFVNQTVILKKKPFCSVEKGTYTENTDFNCVYK